MIYSKNSINKWRKFKFWKWESIKNKIINIIFETFLNENERENKNRDLLNVFEEISKKEK